MKIYTKTGDKGTTGILGGTRLSKHNLRIDSYGTVDELNSYLGLIRDQPVCMDIQDEIVDIQNILFVIGSYLASDPTKSKVVIPELQVEEIEKLESSMDQMDAELPDMRNFILPGGHQSISFCHIARCVCRRAERLVTGLSDNEEVEPMILQYLNRLSDYLFVLSRWMTQELQAEEIPWMPSKQ